MLSQEETAQRRETARAPQRATSRPSPENDAGASPSNAVNRPRPTSLFSENEHGHPETHAYRGRYPFQQEYADLKQLRHNPLEKHLRTRAPTEGDQQQEATEARPLQLTTAAPASAQQGGHRQARADSSAFDAAAASLAVSRTLSLYSPLSGRSTHGCDGRLQARGGRRGQLFGRALRTCWPRSTSHGALTTRSGSSSKNNRLAA